MKILNLNAILIFAIIFIGLKTTSVAQTVAEPQPMMLLDQKITFYSVQMDFASLTIEPTDSSIDTTAPVMTISDDEQTILIDFTLCESGQYIITGTRDDMELQYSVDHIK